MKRCLIALTVALVSVMAVMAQPAPKTYADEDYVQINETNFKDEIFREHIKKFWDKNLDGYLSSSEIEKVKSIYATEVLKDLTGIEYFTALEELDIRECDLTSMDLSSNKALKKVICNNNQLASLTLGNLPALTELDCSYNQLTSLDVTGCPNLIYLDCDFNEIESLDPRKCTQLISLCCARNSLEKLDVSTCKFLAKLDCSSNELRSLNIRNNTTLTYLDCTSNFLQKLDLRYNPELEHLECGRNDLNSLDVSNNTNLNYLNCEKTSITSIDVSMLKSLRTLCCNSNYIESLDISKNTALVMLACEGNHLSELDVTKHHSLRYLNCSYNDLSAIDLSKNTALESLNCSHTSITSLDLSNNTELVELILLEGLIKTVDIHYCPKLVELVKTHERNLYEDYREKYYYYLQEGEDFRYLQYDVDATLIMPDGPILGTVTDLKAASAGKNKVKLTWNAVGAAEGYLVYAQKNGEYGYVGMTTQGTTFTDTKALDSDYNYYWVFAYVKDSNGKMRIGACEKYVYAKGVTLAVTNLKASSVKGGVKLTWTASSGAEGYLVYGIRPGGSYGYIGMTTKGTSFTDAKASKTEYTFYWVFPYHKAADGSMIVGGTAKYTYGRAK